MTCFPYKRFLAIILSLSLLWVFVACICLCGRESSHVRTRDGIRVSVDVKMIEDVPECDECPLNSFPKATSAEQAKPLINSEEALSTAMPPMPPGFCSRPDVVSDLPHGQLCSLSPPLELLSARRI
jgi:hypothetical protein